MSNPPTLDQLRAAVAYNEGQLGPENQLLAELATVLEGQCQGAEAHHLELRSYFSSANLLFTRLHVLILAIMQASCVQGHDQLDQVPLGHALQVCVYRAHELVHRARAPRFDFP